MIGMEDFRHENRKIVLTAPCWMCAIHGGGYTNDCDNKCAYAHLKKEYDEVMEGLRKIDEKVREQEELIRRLLQ